MDNNSFIGYENLVKELTEIKNFLKDITWIPKCDFILMGLEHTSKTWDDGVAVNKNFNPKNTINFEFIKGRSYRFILRSGSKYITTVYFYQLGTWYAKICNKNLEKDNEFLSMIESL